MVEIKSEISIFASMEKVWSVFTDFSKYSEWNPCILNVKGELAEGNKIKVSTRAITFKATILKIEHQKELRWKGHFLFPALFQGEHWFTLEPRLDGSVKFCQGERFTGFLVPLIEKLLHTKMSNLYKIMNIKLKERSEW
jgi:hypothetical protein